MPARSSITRGFVAYEARHPKNDSDRAIDATFAIREDRFVVAAL
jgi:hypothetical protein